MLRRLVLRFVVTVLLMALGATAVPAQPAAPSVAAPQTGSLSGTITDVGGRGLAKVTVSASGPESRSTLTDSAGAFAFTDLAPGVYMLNFVKAGYNPAHDDEVVVAGMATTARAQLSSVSLETISTIGRVSASAVARGGFNTTTASVASVSAQTFTEQGQLGVNNVLNQVPGVSIGFSYGTGRSGYGGGASPLDAGYPSVRGSLPYETASLIDGHPIALGLTGSFDPAFINPYVLQDVEIVKGPGAQPANINYAIGGTINFRTLQPTRERKQSAEFGVDQWGGFFGNVRATGTLGRLGYAFDYASRGTQGYNRAYTPLNPTVLLATGDLVNGRPVCGNSQAAICGIGVIVHPNTPYYQDVTYTSPLAECCNRVFLGSNARNELAKLRYGFSDTTSLTVSYLGAQLRGVPGLYS